MENKTGKYFKYAIGEIVLVVIGILIALSINNWNEKNKSNLKEVKILSELLNDLKSNYQELSPIKNNYTIAQRKSDSLIEVMEENKFDINIHSKLLLRFDRGSLGLFNISNTAFKFIENNGFELLRNDNLRVSISDVYTRRIYNVLFMEKLYLKFFHENTWPYVKTRFYVSKNGIPLPTDVKQFNNDLEFISILNFRARLLLGGSDNIDSCMKDLETLIKEVENEITKLKG